jgi:heme/copper-type cytochrome/quinol oxidase subunit 2
MKHSLGKKTFLVAGTMFAAVIFAACSPKSSTPATDTSENSETTEEVSEGSQMLQTSPTTGTSGMASPSASPTAETGSTEDVKVVEVEAGSFYYKPNEIRVKKGQKVKITLKSVSMMHDFVIDELKVKAPITKSGSVSTVEFVADKVGKFQYYCSVADHKAKGQVGTLIVE